MIYNNSKKYLDNLSNYKIKCKCGHPNIILNKRGYSICTHCGNLVFRDNKVEFDYKLKERIRKLV